MSLINAHSLDPALLYQTHELVRACERYQVDPQRADGEGDDDYHARLLKVGGEKQGGLTKDDTPTLMHVLLCPTETDGGSSGGEGSSKNMKKLSRNSASVSERSPALTDDFYRMVCGLLWLFWLKATNHFNV